MKIRSHTWDVLCWSNVLYLIVTCQQDCGYNCRRSFVKVDDHVVSSTKASFALFLKREYGNKCNWNLIRFTFWYKNYLQWLIITMQNFTFTSCLGILFDHFVLTYLNVGIGKLLSIQLAKCHRRKKSFSGLFFA